MRFSTRMHKRCSPLARASRLRQGGRARVLHHLVDAGCVVLADVERDGAEDLAEVTGATLCEHLDDLTAESLGSLDRFSVETLEGDEGRRERLIFEHANSRLACIDVGGSAGTATEEVIRGLFDALRSVIGAGLWPLAPWWRQPSHRRRFRGA